MEEIRALLEEEIKGEFEALSSLEFGSKEHSMAVDNLTALYKLRIEDARCRRETEEKRFANEQEQMFKREQFAEQVKDRYFKLGMETEGLILQLLFYAIWMRKGFKFEESGTFTSTTFRGLFSRFRPTKKIV